MWKLQHPMQCNTLWAQSATNFFHLSHALCMAKEKKGEEVDTRRDEFEGLWAWRLYLFSSESRLLPGEGEEKGRGGHRNCGNTAVGGGMVDNQAQAWSESKGLKE